eukprot:1148686-Pelagomonas_calceolata.AAC.4
MLHPEPGAICTVAHCGTKCLSHRYNHEKLKALNQVVEVQVCEEQGTSALLPAFQSGNKLWLPGCTQNQALVMDGRGLAFACTFARHASKSGA